MNLNLELLTGYAMTIAALGHRAPDGMRCSANFCPSGVTTV